jgi:hypothetical protein
MAQSCKRETALLVREAQHYAVRKAATDYSVSVVGTSRLRNDLVVLCPLAQGVVMVAHVVAALRGVPM